MKVARAGADGVRVRLNIAESHVLDTLLGELDSAELAPDDPVRQRLYPAAYDDAQAAAAFRDLTEASLERERAERIAGCRADLAAAKSLVRTDLVLDADATRRWLQTLNDMRLALGTRLDITDDDDVAGPAGLDQGDPDVRQRAAYLWLTALQDSVVVAVMG